MAHYVKSTSNHNESSNSAIHQYSKRDNIHLHAAPIPVGFPQYNAMHPFRALGHRKMPLADPSIVCAVFPPILLPPPGSNPIIGKTIFDPFFLSRALPTCIASVSGPPPSHRFQLSSSSSLQYQLPGVSTPPTSLLPLRTSSPPPLPHHCPPPPRCGHHWNHCFHIQ